MLLRVIALWSRSQLIKTIVICLFLFNTSFYLIASFYSYVKKGGGIPQPVSPFTGCIPQPDGRIPLYSIFIMALVFETAVVFFTVLKSYHLSLLLRTPAVGGNEQRQPGHQLTDTGAFRLSNVLFNDGILYYVAVILSHTLSLYASATPIESNPTVSIPIVTAAPAIAATTVACNRLFLRLHDVILTRKSWEDTYGVADGNGDNAGVVSARVTVFAPMDFPLGGGNRNGAHAHLRDSVETTDDVQFSSQFGTVDYDYHDYLREDLKVKKARRLTASGSRHQATTIGSTMRLNGMEMNNFGDGGGKRDMTGEIGSA
ncbi:hypothetical protein FRC17_000667 [Serendipita sp. 399]|nr:hypothetical protein FRC17_000667 [Serendipita sp. 399]